MEILEQTLDELAIALNAEFKRLGVAVPDGIEIYDVPERQICIHAIADDGFVWVADTLALPEVMYAPIDDAAGLLEEIKVIPVGQYKTDSSPEWNDDDDDPDFDLFFDGHLLSVIGSKVRDRTNKKRQDEEYISMGMGFLVDGYSVRSTPRKKKKDKKKKSPRATKKSSTKGFG